jgi:hypothetical protein
VPSATRTGTRADRPTGASVGSPIGGHPRRHSHCVTPSIQ